MASRPSADGGLTVSAAALLSAVLLLLAPGAPAADTAPAQPGAPAADTLVMEDDLGRTVRLAAPPERIVSLVPAATEILFALDAGSRVVGRTRYGTHPPAAAAVPDVGPGMRPSLELVMDRNPDAVVLYAGAANRATVDRLEALGVSVLALGHDTLEDLVRNVRRLGRLTGRGSEARELVDGLRCRLAAVAQVTGEVPPRRVYYEVWSDPPVTVGAGSYLDSLLTVAGARNVFGELEAPSPQVSLESVVSRDPELVIVPRRSGGEAATPPSRRPGWKALEAIRQGRVRQVDGDLVHRLGPRIGEAAAALAAAVHPELAPRLTATALEEACGPATAGGSAPDAGAAPIPGAGAARPAGGGPLGVVPGRGAS